MKRYFKLSLLVTLVLVTVISFYFIDEEIYVSNQEIVINDNEHVDGPFVINNVNNEIEYITTITNENDISVQRSILNRNRPFICRVDNKDNDSFSVKLMDTLKVHASRYPEVKKLFVISDLHGSFNSMASLLVNNGVMDKDYNWSFGDGHLVMIGDITDRGVNTIPCLWLFYHLEKQAQDKLHYLFGNHELMTLYGRASYLHEKTQKSIVEITGDKSANKAIKTLFSKESELGSWLRKRNTIEIIGDMLFVHAGISEKLVNSKLNIDQINETVRKYADVRSRDIPKTDTIARMIFGSEGPIWYRGLVMDYKDYYKKMSQDSFLSIIEHFDVNRIFIGHTEVDNISNDYNGHLIRVNVSQPSEKNSSKAQGLLIDGDNYYRVNGKGEVLKRIN